jgi:hypothetical protein
LLFLLNIKSSISEPSTIEGESVEFKTANSSTDSECQSSLPITYSIVQPKLYNINRIYKIVIIEHKDKLKNKINLPNLWHIYFICVICLIAITVTTIQNKDAKHVW